MENENRLRYEEALNEICQLKTRVARLEEENQKIASLLSEYKLLVAEKDMYILKVASKGKVRAYEREKADAADMSFFARLRRYIKRKLGIGVYG